MNQCGGNHKVISKNYLWGSGSPNTVTVPSNTAYIRIHLNINTSALLTDNDTGKKIFKWDP